MGNIKAIVVGAGGISSAWFGPLKKEGIEIMAVVEKDTEKAKNRLKEFGLEAEICCNLKEVLKKKKPDFVVDLTPPETHCQVTCTALEAGCHVIGEKPMASSMTEARKMVRTADKTGRLYMVSQSRRWNTNLETVRQTIIAGEIGVLTTINCGFFLGAHFGGFRDRMPSPLILDMAIHHFDLARFLSGVDPIAVVAKEFNPKGSWYAGNVSASCIFEMTDGVVFTYEGSWCSEGCHTSWNGDWRIIGDRGTLIYEKDNQPYGQTVAGSEGFSRPLKDLPIHTTKVKFPEMHGALREMLNFIRTGKKPRTECHDNIKSLAMVFSGIESAKKRRWVPVRSL